MSKKRLGTLAVFFGVAVSAFWPIYTFFLGSLNVREGFYGILIGAPLLLFGLVLISQSKK